MKRSILIACVILILSPVVHAMTVDEVPNPQTTAGSFVQDSAGVLGPGYVLLLDGLANNFKNATGAELAIVTVGDMSGATDFAISDPTTWPEQVTPPEPVAEQATSATTEAIPYLTSILIALIVVALVACVCIVVLGIRFRSVKAKAAKNNMVRKGTVLGIACTWITGVVALTITMNITDRVFLLVITFMCAIFGVSALHVLVYKKLRKYVVGYQLECSSCGKPMDLVDEASEDWQGIRVSQMFAPDAQENDDDTQGGDLF